MYKVLKYIVSVIGLVIEITSLVYIAYVLFTPGFYTLFAVFAITNVISFGILIYSKYKLYINRKSLGEELALEDLYATTYRKRYYNKGYIILLAIINITLLCTLTTVVVKQLTYPSNYEFAKMVCESNGYSGEVKDSVFYKARIVIPNDIKAVHIGLAKTHENIMNTLSEAIDEDLKDKVKLEEFNGKVETANQEVILYENMINNTKIKVIVVILLVLLLKACYADFKWFVVHMETTA